MLADELVLQSFLIEAAIARQSLCGYPSSYSQTALQSWATEAGSTSSPSPEDQGGSPLGCRYHRGCTPSILSGLCWHGVSHGCRIPSEKVMAGRCYTAVCFPCLEWKTNKQLILPEIALSPRDSVELLPKSKSCSRRLVIAQPQRETSQSLVSQRMDFVPPAL